ncbi:MAG: asparagine synthase (glutamine-hydrolyzing) [Acidobacteria bacterium]|nr:asparagine synthase (glutamine-hydrolyzing) [Acidobacteriota bacterium]
MCGIAGWVDSGGGARKQPVVRMCESLAHRGPDGEGVWTDPRGLACLGHRRLAIIDLSDAARQPMSNEDLDLWLVFNGEIYNFRKLREDLATAGHRFHSRTDSEVILHGYEEWGLDGLLPRLNGMFAFALWSSRSRQLHLVRDRLGIKPLYVAELAHGSLIFASEAKAILAHGGIPASLDSDGLQSYLAYGYVPHEQSIFHGLKKLRPGHFLSWRDGRTEVRRWWELEYEPKDTLESRADLVESVRERIADAVRARMVADVPVGSFLSGGLDSSTVTANAVHHAAKGFDTFCVGFDSGSQADLEYSRLVSGRLGTRHHVTTVTAATVRSLLPALASVLDEPLYDPSALATWLLAGFARQHVTAALSGTGGDEVFAGYGWFASQVRYARRGRRFGPAWGPIAAASRLLIAGLRRAPLGMRAPGALKVVGRSQPERSFPVRGFFDSWEQRRLLRGAFGQVPNGSHLWLHERTWRPDWPLVPAILNHDLNAFLPDNCLVLLDRTTMAHSLEARVPLLDHRWRRSSVCPGRSSHREMARKPCSRRPLMAWFPARCSNGRRKVSPRRSRRGFGKASWTGCTGNSSEAPWWTMGSSHHPSWDS